jgi:hypothetical protein
LTGIQYLIGYRPFRYRWHNVTPVEALAICSGLRRVAEARRFHFVWNDAVCGSFIAVGQLNRLEELCLSVFNSGEMAGHRNVEMKLASRSIILSGGREISQAGREFVSEAVAC